MKHTTRIALFTALSFAIALVPTAGTCAVKKATPKKPAAKRTVLGTTQLNGDQAKLGVTYTLGKADPINVTLDKVEYSIEPARFGNTIITPKADEKLLVLHYTLHNCNPRNRGLAWNTLEVTAVDANDTNWRFVTNVAMEATGETCNMSLKPAQKTKVYTAILVPAKGEIPKIMLQSHDKLVLRYDIRGKAVKLPAAIADPADASGATALEKVPAEMGVFYRLRELQAKIDSAAFSTDPVANRPPRKGNRFLVIKGTVKNDLTSKRNISWNTIRPKVADMDGGELRWGDETYYASRDEGIRGSLEPGQEIRFKWVFEVPNGVQPASVAVTENVGRAYVYDLSNVQ